MTASLTQRIAPLLYLIVGLLGPNFASNYMGTLLGFVIAATIWLLLLYAATIPVMSVIRSGRYDAGSSVIERINRPIAYWSLVIMYEGFIGFFLLLASITFYKVAHSF